LRGLVGGVVNEHIEPAEFVDRALDQLLAELLLTDIA